MEIEIKLLNTASGSVNGKRLVFADGARDSYTVYLVDKSGLEEIGSIAKEDVKRLAKCS